MRATEGLTLFPVDCPEKSALGQFQEMFNLIMTPPPDNCPQCGGVRIWDRRRFSTVPPFLIFELPAEVSAKCKVAQLQDFAPTLHLEKEDFSSPLPQVGITQLRYRRVFYELSGGTFYDNAHFRGAFISTGTNDDLLPGWHFYDGLSGHFWSGLVPPTTPAGSRLSYIVYSFVHPNRAEEMQRFYRWFYRHSE